MVNVCGICDIEGCHHIRNAQAGTGTLTPPGWPVANVPTTDPLERIAAALERQAETLELRDRFAMAALPTVMQAFLHPSFSGTLEDGERGAAMGAYRIADAMLSERARQPDEAPR